MRQILLIITVISIMVVGLCACGGGGILPNSKLEIAIVNDRPNSLANVGIQLCPLGAGNLSINVGIGADGRGTTGRVETGANQCSVFVTVTCANPNVPGQAFAVNPARESKRTVNCQFAQPVSSNPGWESLSDSFDRIHLDENPQVYSAAQAQAEGSSLSPYDEANREIIARSFLNESNTNLRHANVLYDLLLDTTPPDNTVFQNLQAGQSSEAQIVYIVAGDQFFAASNNDNATFVRKAYNKLLNREPTQWESDQAVSDLNGYWYSIWVEDPCEPPLCTVDGICDPPPPEPCGHWEWQWYQMNRNEFAWQIVDSHEHDQVLANFMYGIQMRRQATSSEIESQAYHIGSYGMKEGGVRLLKTLEFFNKSTNPW
jgi:hypothetical protein